MATSLFHDPSVYSLIYYPTVCSPKGYGSGLPLPSRITAHFSAFKPESCPHLHTSYAGATLSSSPYIRSRATKRKQNTKQSNQKDQPSPRGLLLLHLLPAGLDPRSASASPVPSPSRAAGASSSVASLPIAISYRTPPVLLAPLGGIGLLAPANVGAQVWVQGAVIGRTERRYGQSSGDWINCTASAAHTRCPPHVVWVEGREGEDL